ncbi:MAG: choice-of-anchor tandem repeat NxxGxxAF-containing protein [Myxococcaceae bacterium]
MPSVSPLRAFAALVLLCSTTALAGGYRFTRIADSVADNFQPGNFTCSAINRQSEVAFKASRTAADGFNFFDGIYRRDTDGTLVVIAEDPAKTKYNFLGNVVAINDRGEVSFGASLAGDGFVNAILRGDGDEPVTIASTANQFSSVSDFGFPTTLNKKGEVAFLAGLPPPFVGPQGVFSGKGGDVTTHYRTDRDVVLDGKPARFFGSFARPSINKQGDVAFQEFLSPNFESGVFVGQEGRFKTIASAAPFTDQFGTPSLNEHGVATFIHSFFDGNGNFVTEIAKGDGGPLTRVADSTQYGFFTGAPAINGKGEVAFKAYLPDFSANGIFTGANPATAKVIQTGDTLDGAQVSNINFCEQNGVNDSGEITFTADLFDDAAPFGSRSAVFKATPVK